MPFTFSHPAIILPLDKIFKKKVSLTGLIIGSLTPDFEYFLRMKIQSEYSHTIWGNLWFNLPLGIILCFIFHCIVKKSLIDNSPLFIQKKLANLRKTNWRKYFSQNWVIVCFSLIIGGYSHILWDSFTHYDAFFTNYFSLDREIFYGIPWYKFLQHFSSLIGAVIVLLYFFNIKSDDEVQAKQPKISYWLKIFIVLSIVLIIRSLCGLQITEYGNVIVSGIAAVMFALTVVAMSENIRLR